MDYCYSYICKLSRLVLSHRQNRSLSMMIRGLVFVFLLTLGAFSSLVLLIPSIITLWIHSKKVIGYRRRYISLISGIYFDFAGALLMKVFGVKVYLYSNSTDFMTDKVPLIISNHRTTVDWMFTGWCYGSFLKINSNIRVILKDSLRSVPVYGWAQQVMLYIFLSRRKDRDLPVMKRMLIYLFLSEETPSIFLFPEGTDLSESNMKKSNLCKLKTV